MEKSISVEGHKETLRMEAFSDGIFCVAITLLAIEIGVEVRNNVSNEELWRSLLDLWPNCLAYFLSFANILLAWIGHHGLFKNLKATDSFLMISNGMLLMLIALVPLPTKTLGFYLNTAAFKTAVVFYTGYFVLISLAFKLLWYAASRKRNLLVNGITEEHIKKLSRTENIGLISNTFIAGIAFINPWLALVLSFVMWIYWVAFG
jgi:uncharacterized membrane protein